MANESENSLHTLAAAFAIVFAIGLFALHLFKFPMDATILDTQYQVESSRAQTIFYQTLLGLFAVICASVLLWPNAKIIPSVGWADQVLAVAVVIAAIFLGSWRYGRMVAGFRRKRFQD